MIGLVSQPDRRRNLGVEVFLRTRVKVGGSLDELPPELRAVFKVGP
jgi:hypothetical protein